MIERPSGIDPGGPPGIDYGAFFADLERQLSGHSHTSEPVEIIARAVQESFRKTTCPFLDLLQKSGSRGLRDLEGGANYGLRQVRFQSVCIRVHPWPISKSNSWDFLSLRGTN